MPLLPVVPPPTRLPYYCDPAALPDSLPTSSEIESATAALPTIRDPRYGRIVVVKGCFVVKYGKLVTENEGHALLLLEKFSSIPTPQLFAMYREDDKLYLIMSLMAGRQLSLLWDELSENEKLGILSQLQEIWGDIRSIPSPPSFSSVSGGPLRHRFFLWPRPEPKITGPFETEEDLNQALALHSQRNWESTEKRSWISEFFARNLRLVLSGHRSMFTHGDIQRKNILVEQLPAYSDDMERRFKVCAVLDWENAGWYPSYWEYAGCFVDFVWTDDWPEKVERFLTPWMSESTMLRMVRQDLDY